MAKAIAQALAYMLSNPVPGELAYGMVLNGSEFLFIKLGQEGICFLLSAQEKR